MRMLLSLAFAASALLLPACDSGGESPEPPTTFEVSVTGDDVFQFEGIPLASSFAVVDPRAPSDTLSFSSQIYLTALSSAERPSLSFRLAEELAVGTFTLRSRLETLGGTHATLSKREGDALLMAEATSGTLTVSRADEEAVEGTFRFVTETGYAVPGLDGMPFPPMGGEVGDERPYAVTVVGAFVADRRMQAPPGGGPRPSLPYTPLP